MTGSKAARQPPRSKDASSGSITDVVLIGPPGAGKTHFLRNYAFSELSRRGIPYAYLDMFQVVHSMFGNVVVTKSIDAARGLVYMFESEMLSAAYSALLKSAAESAHDKEIRFYEFATAPGFPERVSEFVNKVIPHPRAPIVLFMKRPRKACLANNLLRPDYYVPIMRTYLSYDDSEIARLRRLANAPFMLVTRFERPNLAADASRLIRVLKLNNASRLA